MVSPTTDRRLGLAGNTAYKVPATTVATTNITLSGQQTVGGVAVLASNAAGVPDRVLATGQTDATQNGLWDVSTAAWTRSIDANGNYDLTDGTQVVVIQGANVGTVWMLTTAAPITVGTTAMTWVLFASSVSLLGNTVIWTSNYTTFVAAVAAAAGKHLVLNSALPVLADISLPSTMSMSAVIPGLLTVSGGATLTINCELAAGSYQIFAGAGSVVFGTASRAAALPIWSAGTKGAVYTQSRTLTQTDGDTTGPVHAFEDNNTLNFTHTMALNFNAYASYDAQAQITGAGAYDHHVSFQARPTYSGSTSIYSRWDGFNFLGTHSGSGTVAAMRGVHIQDPLGAGVITALYGVFVQKMTRGADSYGFYSATPVNAISVGIGEAASWLLRGNGQVGGFGLSLQSRTDSLAHVLQTANQALLFGANNIYYGAITAAGLWKMSTVGVTDILSANQMLEVSGAGGATFKATGGAAVGAVLTWNNDTTGNNIFNNFYTETAASLRGSIDFNRGGTLTRYNTTSDATLKNVIGDAPQADSVEILEATRLREYSWKEDPTNKPQIGVIAQELYETFKGAVSVGGDYEDTVDGETVKKYRPWGVDKTAFTFHLIAGFQYQQAQIKALETRLAALEAKLAEAK